MTRSALIVLLAAILPYARSIDNYFVQDDFGVVWLLAQKPWSYFPRWFVSTWMDDIWGYTPDEIRPFPAVTYQIAAALSPGSPVADHVMNIGLHAANGVLVLLLAHHVARLPWAAATFAAVVFAVMPMHAETVAWVTGRVDSLPALFYLSSFIAYARWRAGPGDRRLYWVPVAIFFLALFSKQNAITLAPALMLFDLLVERRPVSLSWTWVRPYVPFVLLTLGYFALRYELFGEVARESQLTRANMSYFSELVARHARRTVFGHVDIGSVWQWALAASVLTVVVVRAPRVATYFVCWWVIGVAPVLVAAYESPRHVYLASVGWAVLLGLAFNLVAQGRRGRHMAAIGAAALVLGAYSFQLVLVVQDWERRSFVSARAVADLEREALAAAPGTLVIAGAPVSSWEWAAPFVLKPPFVGEDLGSRITLITPWLIDCCRAQWEGDTRARLREWIARGALKPVVALRWNEAGQRFRMSSNEEPYLRALLSVLLETDSAVSLDRGIQAVLERVPAVR
jgi:hypothetical protein